MPILDQSVLGNDLRTWGIALAITIGGTLILRLLQRFLVARLGKRVGGTSTAVDDAIQEIMSRTNILFLLLVCAYAGAGLLTLPERAAEILGRITFIALLAQVGLWGSGVINYYIAHTVNQREGRGPRGATTVNAIGVIGTVVLWVILALIALDNIPGVEVDTLVASLGIGGVAAALAVQNILSDLFASLSIALDQPFEIGDFIVFGGDMGTIERIGIRSTRVRSLSGEQLVISNTDLLDSRIHNYKRMAERRVVFSFGVVYETPPELLARIPGIVEEIIAQQGQTRFDRAHLKEFGDFSLNFEAVYYVLAPEYGTYMDIQQAINLALHARFEREGIEFAYPTQLVYLDGGEELAGG
jgi:small-conductance mechanosensitive channel